MRQPIAGNWKINRTSASLAEIEAVFSGFPKPGQVNGANTSVTERRSSNYATKPICRATASTTSGGAAASASVTSVTLQPYGTTVVFKTSAAVPHIYGSCHSATG
jgi:hypothetical protein